MIVKDLNEFPERCFVLCSRPWYVRRAEAELAHCANVVVYSDLDGRGLQAYLLSSAAEHCLLKALRHKEAMGLVAKLKAEYKFYS